MINAIGIGININRVISSNPSSGEDNSFNTTGANEQIIGGIGDSIMFGDSTPTTALPLPIDNTMYVDATGGTTFTEVTTALTNPWVAYSNKRYTESGYKTILVNAGSPSSTVYPDPGAVNGETNCWVLTGTLYAAWKSRMNNALAAKGLTRPRVIFIILGVNDSNRPVLTYPTANFITGAELLIANLIADFPNTPIVWLPPTWNVGNSDIYDFRNITATKGRVIRKKISELAQANTNVFVGPYMHTTAQNGYNQPGEAHYTDLGNIVIGEMCARWMNAEEYNKYARAVICSHYDDLSTTRKNAIQTLINSFGADWHVMDGVQNYVTTDRKNVFVDFRGIVAPADVGGSPNSVPGDTYFVFQANSYIRFDGAASYLGTGLLTEQEAEAIPQAYSTRDNLVHLCYLKTNRSAGALKSLFGGSNAGGGIQMRQLASAAGARWRASTTTDTTLAGEGNLDDETWYGIIRTNSTASALLKDVASIQTSSNTSTGIGVATYVGARNSSDNLTASEPMNCDVCGYLAGPSTIDWVNAITAMETFWTNWNS